MLASLQNFLFDGSHVSEFNTDIKSAFDFTFDNNCIRLSFIIFFNCSKVLDSRSPLVLGDPCLVLGGACLVFGDPCLVLGGACLVFGDPCLVSGDSFLVLGGACLVFGDPCLVLGGACMEDEHFFKFSNNISTSSFFDLLENFTIPQFFSISRNLTIVIFDISSLDIICGELDLDADLDPGLDSVASIIFCVWSRIKFFFVSISSVGNFSETLLNTARILIPSDITEEVKNSLKKATIEESETGDAVFFALGLESKTFLIDFAKSFLVSER